VLLLELQIAAVAPELALRALALASAGLNGRDSAVKAAASGCKGVLKTWSNASSLAKG
jgi:hypothetical protein